MVKELIARDDFDGSMPAETVQFGYEGRHMEIDLSEENRDKFHQCIAPFVEHGRDVEVAPPPAPRRGRQARPSPQGRPDLPAIRQWAREQGKTVADRGRISREIIDAFDREQAAKP